MIERGRAERLPRDDSVEAHQQELLVRSSFLTVRELAQRWRVSETTIRDIPYDRLPYFQVGSGGRRIHRRYDPALVVAYERGQLGRKRESV